MGDTGRSEAWRLPSRGNLCPSPHIPHPEYYTVLPDFQRKMQNGTSKSDSHPLKVTGAVTCSGFRDTQIQTWLCPLCHCVALG